MRQYDFTTLPDRLKTNSVKWKEVQKDKDLLPLWVADMDFLTFPEMTKAFEDFAQYGVYGYSSPKESLFQSIIAWEKQEQDYLVERDALILIEGVVPAISVAVQAFSKEGEAVLINTPVYPPFARTVKMNKRKLITNSLIEINGHFEIDFAQLEKDIKENAVKIFIFCSPHNPGGRVWSSEELLKVGEICRKYGVILVSDEIHQDLALFGHKHHTINTVSDNFKDFTVLLSSATKTFNIAGTKNSFAVIENPELRQAFKERQLANNQHEISSLGLLATETAYTYGKPWLQELKTVIEENINYSLETLTKNSKIQVMKPEGTYLVWLDFSDYTDNHSALSRKIREEAKLILNDGLSYGREGKNISD